MFEKWYPQDGKMITTTPHNIKSTKRVITIFLFKLYDYELSVTEIVEYLRPQTLGTFDYWYNTSGLLHEQLQSGLMERCMFYPPILFETREIENPPKELEFVVQ